MTNPPPPKGFVYRAIVEVLVGSRRVSEIMAAFDLGVTAVGCKRKITLTYKPNEPADEERVKAAMDALMSDRTMDYGVLHYEVKEIAMVRQEENDE